MSIDSPSRPRLAFDIPFRVIGYVGAPADEVGVLLWSGIDPHRYFGHEHPADRDRFSHLLTLDYAGRIVAWQAVQAAKHTAAADEPSTRVWTDISMESMDVLDLNTRIRNGEPLRYQ